MTATESPTELRRRSILESAIQVFLRYGYRKMSMEEVAKAAKISRQSLYDHFTDKESLFKATVFQSVETSMNLGIIALNAESIDLEDRIINAFDKWEGEHISASGVARWELIEAAFEIVGEDFIKKYQFRVKKELEKGLKDSRINVHSLFTIKELAEVLQNVCHGVALQSSSRKEYVKQVKLRSG